MRTAGLGSGKSGLFDRENIGMEDYADCIKKILDTEKIAHCSMIGHSMGGYITLAFAEKYPGSLSSFGLFHSSAYADDEAKRATRKKAIDFIKTNGAEAFLKTSIPGLFYDQGNSGPADALIEKGKAFSSKALLSYYTSMINRPDRTNVLKSFSNPLLFVMGEHDNAVPFQQSLQQCYPPQKAHVHILRNSAHMGMLEETERSNQILAQFLRSATT